ncbi:MAG: FtsX-like permease family protein [Cyclobacteriaceae bacterium]|jgi:putative ABC transport system permease protein
MPTTDNKRLPTPPNWANRFLEWYCHPRLLEEIQGDAHELFYRTAATHPAKAKAQFVWNVLRFFRWRNIRKERLQPYSPTSAAMIKSYFLTGFRNILRNLTPSLINITGLSVALGCTIMIFILEDSYYHLDQWHEKSDRIYEVVSHVREGNETRMFASSPYQLADLLADNSAVEDVARMRRNSASIRVGDNVFQERVSFVDPAFLEIFSFRTIAGDRSCLVNRNQLLLTEQKAIAYFGNSNPVGQTLSIKFRDDAREDFIVGGVLENSPLNSSMYFDFLLPMAVWERITPARATNWSDMSVSTFVALQEGNTLAQLDGSLNTYKTNYNATGSPRPVTGTEMVPLELIARRSYTFVDALSWSNHPSAMIAFGIMAVFLILLACFNYMNVAVASVSTRLKEIGIRKVVGSGKKEIIQQFLTENVLVCAIALMVGCALAYFVLIPSWNTLYDVKMAFPFSSWQMIFIFFGGLLMVVALVSGAYPALYVSSFNAVKILKGKEKFGSKSLFSKVLLGAQFTLSFTSLVGCQVFMWSSFHFENKDWGYNQQETIAIPVQTTDQYRELRDRAATHPQVANVAGTNQHIGRMGITALITNGTEEISAQHFRVGFGYLEAMNIRLKTGRLFEEKVASDNHESVIVNESFAKSMGWAQPLNQSFDMDTVKRYVVGVVEDFYYDDFYNAIGPAVITIAPEETFRVFVARAEAGHVGEVHDFLKKSWKEVAPEDPYNGYLQSEVFDSFLRGNRANNKVLYFISAISILLVAMGLYGLVSYNLTRRLKEFSVRKIFGANTVTLFGLMNRDYLGIVLVAFFLGAPLGAYLMNMMIKSIYPEHIPQSTWPYLVAISSMLVVVVLTVGSQLKRVVQENPTVTLRAE